MGWGYATLAHEVTHWTGHESRLHREFGKRFGDDAYALEELVAELGAACLCANLHLAPEPREETTAYIASWLKVLKADKHAVFTAASQAQKAADFLHQRRELAAVQSVADVEPGLPVLPMAVQSDLCPHPHLARCL